MADAKLLRAVRVLVTLAARTRTRSNVVNTVAGYLCLADDAAADGVVSGADDVAGADDAAA